mmetsp:Transcript_38395/g.63232  ORF Transcript_38395/g.63232 Transcript_38395/m.63232 type:complete len:101 (-) Transcript_38395:302-604(-)
MLQRTQKKKWLFLFHCDHFLSASPTFIFAGSQKAFAVSLQFLAHIPGARSFKVSTSCENGVFPHRCSAQIVLLFCSRATKKGFRHWALARKGTVHLIHIC